MSSAPKDPLERLAKAKREFGEYGGVNASCELSTTFTVLAADTLPAIFAGEIGPEKGACFLYGRSFNPTVLHLSRQLAALEGSEAAYCCSSGMAAISSTLLSLCSAGDHIVASNAVYGGTFALLKDFLPHKCGITTTFVPVNELEAVRAAITDKTKVVYTETVSNPTLVVADLPALAEIAHSKGVQLVVDNTFTPAIVSPIQWGADVVVHSLTKFISGASDIIAGAVCGRGAFISSLMDLHMGSMMLLGPTMDPRVASELSLRIPHLGLRMGEHSRRAQHFAEQLQQLGGRVTYPALPQHPQHELLKKLANPGYGYGGMLTLELGCLERAKVLMERLQNKHGFGLMAVSLGYFDTLMSASAVSTSSELSGEELALAGISSGLVRMSVGLTGSLEQRWRQLEEAFLAVQAAPPGGKPAYKAAQLVRDPVSGLLHRTPSWHSFGSAISDDTGDEDVLLSAPSASLPRAAALQPADSTVPPALGDGVAPACASAAPAGSSGSPAASGSCQAGPLPGSPQGACTAGEGVSVGAGSGSGRPSKLRRVEAKRDEGHVVYTVVAGPGAVVGAAAADEPALARDV